VQFTNFVPLVKIKLNEQGTVKARNIFDTITEESNINLLKPTGYVMHQQV